MLNKIKIKISATRQFIKKKDNTSPKVKYSCSSKKIDEQEYYKPAVELIYKMLKEKENQNESEEISNEKINNCG